MTPSAPVRMVALLRGVNVGGVTIKSAELREVFEGEGVTDVRTVLASGNVAFNIQGSESDGAALTMRIETALEHRFRYDARIVLRTQQQIAAIAAAYPFARSDQVDHPYVIFSSQEQSLAELHSDASSLMLDVESMAPGAGVLYWRVPRGQSLETPFAKLLAKASYRRHLTTRNLRTVEKLALA